MSNKACNYFTKSILFFLFLFPFFSNAQTTKEEFVQLGLKQHNDENYNEAIAFYNKAIALDPLYGIAYLDRGDSYFEQQDYQNAVTDADKALRLNPESAIAYHNKGLALKFQGKNEEAIVQYNKAISLDKNSYVVYADKIRAQLAIKKTDEAKATAENLKKEFPNVPDSYIIAFIYHALIGDTQNALKELDNAVNADPKDDKALDHRGRYKEEIGDDKGAVADFNKLISMKPGKAEYYYNRSSANYDLKNYDAVISDCKNAIVIDENFYKAYTMLGDVYDTYGDKAKSIANYEKAISIRPNKEYAYNELGKIYYLQKDYKNALHAFNRILEKKPNVVSSLEYRADCNYKLLNYKAAIEDYTKLISLNPNKYENYMNRANVELDAGNKTDACADMKKGAKMTSRKVSEEYLFAHTFLYKNCRESLNPKLVKVNDLYDQAYGFYTSGKRDLAIQKYDEMIKILPDSAYLYFNRGKLKRELNLHEEAISDYKKAVKLDKMNVESWTAMGISYMYLHQYDNSIKSFLEAIKKDSSYAIPYNNIAQVYREKKDNTNALKYLELAVEKDPLYTVAYFSLGELYADAGNKEKACYNFKRAEALGEPKARIKILSECE